ncbi:MAG: penicillin acylase family protein [Pseudomonadota bacterium]
MATLFKWLARAFAAVCALAIAGLLLAWTLLAGSVPDYDRVFEVEGVSARTLILRDAYAVPHIRGATEDDVFFALGFAHAQDRLWQMETSRRAAQGRLSELFGEAALPFDRFVRALDLDGLGRRGLAAQSARAQAALEAYARGVNAFIRAAGEEALGRGAPEFYLFGGALAPWRPADSLSISRLMALRLTDQAAAETRRAALSLRVDPRRLRDLLPDYPEPALIEAGRLAGLPTTAPEVDYAALVPGPYAAAAAAPLPDAMQVMPPAGRGGASNGWAISASRAASGAPILANDPHLWLTAPSIWHLARLELPATDGSGGAQGIIGATIPGLPLVLVGRNADFAWGLTSAYVDDADVYIERLNPQNPDEYLAPDGPRPFETRETLIALPGGRAEPVTLRRTRHGPVIPPDQLGVAQITPEGHVAALSWTGLSEDDRSFTAGFDLMTARSLGEGVRAMEPHVAPAMNVFMADRTGVGMIVAGRAPLRDPQSRSQGRIPAPGWLSDNDWQGFLPYAQMPRALRPASGAVANANNRTASGAFPRHVSFHWGDPYRIRRLDKQLAAREFHTLDSAAALQNDAVSEMARAVLPLIARDLWWTGPAAPADPAAALRQDALERLADWNGEMSEHAPEPLIFAEWMRRLTERLAGDELGPALARVEGANPVFVERVFRNVQGAGVWCDIDKTSRVETCAEMAGLALDDALAGLSEAYGGSLSGWRWGEAHEARHDHEVLGGFVLPGLIVNIRHAASGGDYTLLRTQSVGRGPAPHAAAFGAGLRMVVDFSDPDASRYIISTGQSGHPFSRNYDDLSQIWRRGDAIRMSLDFADAEAGAVGLTLLEGKSR